MCKLSSNPLLLSGSRSRTIANVFKQAGVEGSGELFTEMANILAAIDKVFGALGRKVVIEDKITEVKGRQIKSGVNAYFERTKPQKSAQLIFCDLATPKGNDKTKTSETPKEDEAQGEEETENVQLYQDIKKQLVLRGVPVNEIAFIHDARKRTHRSCSYSRMSMPGACACAC